ncbi:MAG: phage portal protein [Phascolarctobacterium sp.]|nr:phage portal protein [Candidatus Phascolarctobacterium caballi]
MDILQQLKGLGFDTVPEDFYRLIDGWKEWYDGDVRKFHSYHIYNGQSNVLCHRYGMGMAKKVCEDWANLLMNEKVHVTLEGEKEQEFLDTVLKGSNFTVKANEMQELKCAYGTVAYVPRVVGVPVNKETGNVVGTAENIILDYVYGKNVLPLSWSNGEVTECAFATEHVTDNDKYVYMQVHRLNSQKEYDIENHLYDNNDGSLTEIKLTDSKLFENIPPVVHTHSKERQFVIDRMNVVNNADPTLPMGVAIFSNAIDNLKACDIAYDSYVNEFVLGKKRVMVKAEATKDFDGNPFFDPDDLAFYMMPEDSEAGSMIHEINMELRAAQHNAGIQDMLNLLSAKVGFGENHYKFNQGSIATATQIISENSTLFRTIKKHEIVLETVLERLTKIILRMGNQFMNAGLNEDVEMSIDFDDSIIEDKQTDFGRDVQMLSMGIIQPYEFRMKWMNEDEETAKKALPQMTQMMGGIEEIEGEE